VRKHIRYAYPILCCLCIISSSSLFSEAQAPLTKAQAGQFNYLDVVSEIDMTSIRSHISHFTDLGTRVTGYPGSEAAAQYIFDSFKSYGLSNVQYHNITAVVPIDYGATLEVLSPERNLIQVRPLWPNLVATVATKPEGIIGHLIYAGNGYLEEFDNKTVEGSIVLLDFNSGLRWLNAAKFGAKAVIFMEPEDTTFDEAQFKTIGIAFSFPRFYISTDQALYLKRLLDKGEAVTVRLVSDMRWEARTACNVIGFVNGSDYPHVFIAITAYYDSFSVVPSVAPGAEESCGIATLLELAKYFQNHRPRYTLMFIAFTGHNLGLLGVREFTEDYAFGTMRDVGKNIWLLINLDLSTGSNDLAPMSAGPYYRLQSYTIAPLMSIVDYISIGLANEISAQLNKVFKPSRLGASWSITSWGRLMPLRINPLDHEPFLLCGAPGMSLGTTYDTRRLVNTPIDTYDHLNFENLKRQVEFTFCVLYNTVNVDFDFLKSISPFPAGWAPMREGGIYGKAWGFAILKGVAAVYNYSVGWYSPVEGAVIFAKSPYAARGLTQNVPWWHSTLITMSEADGSFVVHGIPQGASSTWGRTVITVYKANSTGSMIYAPDFGKYAYSPQAIGNIYGVNDVGYYTLLRSGSLVLLDFFDPRRLQVPADESLYLEVNNFVGHSVPDSFGAFTIWWTGTGSSVGIAHLMPDEPMEVLVKASYARRYPLATLINSSEENPEGTGYIVSLGEQIILTHTPFRLAENLYWLNDQRLSKALQRGIQSKAITTHAETRKVMDTFWKSIRDKQYGSAYNCSTYAWNLALQTYNEARKTTEDSVYAVTLYALLLIPFAFLAERLFFGFGGFKRLGSIIVIILLVIFVFWFLHPGFALAYDISMVLVGFTILVLIVPIYSLIVNIVMEAVRWFSRKLLGAHRMEAVSAALFSTSFAIGLENMKKRKLRSSLTLFSIMLMVIAMVLFTSVSAFSILQSIRYSGKAPYEGILIRPTDWSRGTFGVGENILETLQVQYGSASVVVPRAWMYAPLESPPGQDPIIIFSQRANTSAFAILGLAPEEVEVTKADSSLSSGRWILPSDAYVCLISENLAKRLDVKEGERIKVSAIDFTLVGIVKDEMFQSIVDIDQERITPLYVIPQAAYNIHLPPESVIIVPYETAMMMGGKIFSVAVRPNDPGVTARVAREIFERYGWDTYVSYEGGLFKYTAGTAYLLIGWQFQLLPMVLILLTMLNLMLAAVYERSNEIFVYSSLGVSPKHIASMFLSESVCFALVGSMIGYIIAMISIAAISKVSNVTVLFLNYSSTYIAGVVGLVTLITVISTLYPMSRASKLVTPSLERAWKPPTKPRGDDWVIPLPLSIESDEESAGFLYYLSELMEAHRSEAAETFSVHDIKYEKSQDERGRPLSSLEMVMRLTPYDAGIIQDVRFDDVKDVEGRRHFFELFIHRRDGLVSVWKTSNRSLVDLIRKQMLLWRTLPHETRREYEERAHKALE